MRTPLGLLLAAVLLGGCAGLDGLLVPAPSTPAPRPTVAVEGEATPLPSEPEAIATEPPPAVAAPRPAPVTPPAPAPTPPAPPAPAPAPSRSASIPTPPPQLPVLAPQASAEEVQRLKTQAERRIEGTEQLVRKIEPSRLAREQQENYRTIKSFLVKAREALSSRDIQRAFTLADKAYLLAEEMSKAPR